MATGFDLAELLSQSNIGSDMFNALSSNTTANAQAQNNITDIMVKEATAAKEAIQTIEQVKGQAALVTQNANLKIANQLGTDVNQVGYRIGELGKRVIDADAAAQESLKTVRAKQSISFIDNPLGYLYAQATVDSDIDTYNSFVTESDLAKETATKLQSLTSSGVQIQNSLTASVNESSIAAAKIVRGYEYVTAANSAALQGLRTNLQGMQQAAQATAQAIDFKFKGQNAIAQERQYQLSLASHAMSVERFKLEKQARAEKLSEESLIGKYIEKGFFNLSGGVEIGEAKKADYIRLYNGGRGDPRIVEMFESGLESYMISADGRQSILSTSPAKASDLFARGRVANLPEAQMKVGEWLIEQRRDFANPAVQNAMKIDPADKKGAEGAFNKFVTDRAKADAARGTGIYTPAPIELVVSQNPNMAALPVWQKVLAPMSAAGVKLDNPNLVAGAVQAAVMKGTLSYNEALELPTIYGNAVNTNNMARNWVTTGLPNGTGYKGNLSAYGSMGKVTVELTDKQEFATWLNKSSASTAAMAMRAKMFKGMQDNQGLGN